MPCLPHLRLHVQAKHIPQAAPHRLQQLTDQLVATHARVGRSVELHVKVQVAGVAGQDDLVQVAALSWSGTVASPEGLRESSNAR